MGHGRYKLWAAVASVLFHVVVLSVMAASRLHPQSAQFGTEQKEQARVAAIKHITQSCPVVPKPDVKRSSGKKFVSRLPESTKPAKALATKARINDDKPVSPPVSNYADMVFSDRNERQQVQFFSSGAVCKRLCYLVDCSGSMKGLFGQVKEEMIRSIQTLQPDQYFGIIFFGDDRVVKFAGGKLVRASTPAKAKALTFIKSTSVAGRTNALAGFKSAVRMRNEAGDGPEVILFLTDGFELSASDAYQFRQRVIELRRKYLSRCQINAIGFWPSQSDRRLLESIAYNSGGEFTCATESDL